MVYPGLDPCQCCFRRPIRELPVLIQALVRSVVEMDPSDRLILHLCQFSPFPVAPAAHHDMRLQSFDSRVSFDPGQAPTRHLADF